MADTPEQVVAKAEAVTQSAEAATQEAKAATLKAEGAAKRTNYMLGAGFLFALVGAVLAFALKDSGASILGVSLEPLGGVLFAAGALLIAGAAISWSGSGHSSDPNSIRNIAGLLAVLAGITAVTALTIVTVTKLGSGEKNSMVAVTSSAFGIISAVVGAYLGIKVSSETTRKAGENEKKAEAEGKKAGRGETGAAIVHHEMHLTKHQVAGMEAWAQGKDPMLLKEMQAAGARARDEEAARIVRPPAGDGAT